MRCHDDDGTGRDETNPRIVKSGKKPNPFSGRTIRQRRRRVTCTAEGVGIAGAYLHVSVYIISRKLSRSRRSRVGKKEHHQSVQSTATFGGGGVDDSMDGAGRVGRSVGARGMACRSFIAMRNERRAWWVVDVYYVEFRTSCEVRLGLGRIY